ncbi:MAG: glutamine amidotransferase [Clostridia bacterium]|nr:glutamine amidotransferase [Clostridia bacterium]
MKITIAHLYPDMLNLYGDSGNIATLKHRLVSRGIDAEIKTYVIEDDIDFENTDIVFIGGGGEREQLTVCNRLKEISSDLKAYAENGGVILAVCGGFEVLGKYYKTASATVEGAGVLDITTDYCDKKFVGNAVIESDLIGTTIVGFENHSGRVDIGTHTPLGKVLCGFGHNGKGAEGVVYKNVIATYLHGPLLPKNPVLADYILSKAIEKRYGTADLAPIDDTLEIAAHDYAVGRFLSK